MDVLSLLRKAGIESNELQKKAAEYLRTSKVQCPVLGKVPWNECDGYKIDFANFLFRLRPVDLPYVWN